jgi:hypothetical protein
LDAVNDIPRHRSRRVEVATQNSGGVRSRPPTSPTSDSTQSSPRKLRARGKKRPNSPESSRTHPHTPTLSSPCKRSHPKLSGRCSVTHNGATWTSRRQNVDSNHARDTLPPVHIHPHLSKDRITIMSDNNIDNIIERRICEHSIGCRMIELNGTAGQVYILYNSTTEEI